MDASAPAPLCVLFDNGSLRPEATLQLRLIAIQLQAATGASVRPVSLLHSSAIAPAELGGVPAQILEPALRALLAAGASRIVLLPLFFGPSAALTEYVPQRLELLRREHPAACVQLGRGLVDVEDETDTRIAAILADHVRAVIRRAGLARPNTVLVDHGSPRREVVAVRDFLGRQLFRLLAQEVGRLAVASMERRPEPEYDFCGPRLATLLGQPGFSRGNVVVARQFFSPGRHAGPEGDVAGICAAAERAQPGLKCHLTDLIGGDPRLIAVLADRYAEARTRG
ncbi:MAG: CbiX/SirB N-terminal domain-containing protein [Opitutaceae bacterium]|nr:CbiX/SirB N-terminal domain-containing protein [Opitutaceae bacterium]